MSDDSKLQKKHIKTQGSVCTHAHRLENSNHQHLRWIVQWKCDLGTERGNRHAFDDLSFGCVPGAVDPQLRLLQNDCLFLCLWKSLVVTCSFQKVNSGCWQWVFHAIFRLDDSKDMIRKSFCWKVSRFSHSSGNVLRFKRSMSTTVIIRRLFLQNLHRV